MLAKNLHAARCWAVNVVTGDEPAGLLTAFALFEDVSIPAGPVRHHQLAMGGAQMFESWDWWR